jgi:hypothetical protein
MKDGNFKFFLINKSFIHQMNHGYIFREGSSGGLVKNKIETKLQSNVREKMEERGGEPRSYFTN